MLNENSIETLRGSRTMKTVATCLTIVLINFAVRYSCPSLAATTEPGLWSVN